MGVYIPRAVKPTDCEYCLFNTRGGKCYLTACDLTINDCPLIEIPTPHGRLIDANKLEEMMYHEAFEIDSDMQKWDSGCWIRYKVFENCMNRLLPDTILEAEE